MSSTTIWKVRPFHSRVTAFRCACPDPTCRTWFASIDTVLHYGNGTGLSAASAMLRAWDEYTVAVTALLAE